MPSFDEIRQHLAAHYKLLPLDEKAPPKSLTIGFRFEIAPGKTASQLVHGYEEVHGQDAWLVAYSDVCPSDFIDHEEALKQNAKLMVGSLAIRDGRCVVRHSWSLRAVDSTEISRGLQYLALGSAAMQKLVRPPPPKTPAPTPDPNTHFSD